VRKLPSLLIGIALSACCNGQENFLTLKKGNRTIKTYMKGSYVECTHIRNVDISGLLVKTTADSIVLNTFQLQRFQSPKGFVLIDTVFTGKYMFGLNEIKQVHVANNKKFSFKTSEYTAYIAAGVFSAMALVNGLKFDDGSKTSLRQAAIRGGSLLLLGRIFHWLGRSDFKIGKRYRLAIIRMGV
jgi:hypothetical protein